MTNEQDLMQRLAVSKQIMEKHGEIKRGDARPSMPMVEDYKPVNATYNLPQEFLTEETSTKSYHDPSKPLEQDRIMNSKLPDEIKKLMIEHPIEQPNNMSGPTLSNDLIEAASRLMKSESAGNIPPQQRQPQGQPQGQNVSGIDYSLIKSIIRDTINEVLTEKGLIPESVSKTKEQISFRVGQHIFEGVVTKIKKLK